MALLALVFLAFAALTSGRALLRLLRCLPGAGGASATYAILAGLGAMGYGMFALGLAGHFTPTAVAGLCALLYVAGLRDIVPASCDLALACRSVARVFTTSPPLHRVIAAALAANALVALAACWSLPGGHEWDSLSYHLAVPRLYAMAGQIYPVETIHHSNFPFLVQMLFGAALMIQGVALAKMVSWLYYLLAVSVVAITARQRLAPRSAALAVAVFAAAPAVAWQAGVAYIDVAHAAYVLAAIAAFLAADVTPAGAAARRSGLMMGLALGVKTLSLIPLVLLAGAWLCRRVGVRKVVAYAGIAIAVGSPFYIKTLAWTGNPVYPFAYSVFGGKHWSKALADTYATEHVSFGLDRDLPAVGDDLRPRKATALPGMGDRVRNLLLTPQMLVAMPRVFYNYNDPGTHSHLGFLFLALAPMAFLARRRAPGTPALAAIACLWFVTWAFTMQYERYLIPLLGVVAWIGADAAARLAGQGRAIRWCVDGAALAQACLTLATVGLGVHGVAVQRAMAGRSPSGVNSYNAMSKLNGTVGTVLFEETRGYYLGTPYLWGNAGHSTYIPYGSFHNASEMVGWFTQHRVGYALVNMQFSSSVRTPEDMAGLRRAVETGTVTEFMLATLPTEPVGTEVWRKLLPQAVREGLAEPIADLCVNGCVVVRFRPPKEGS